ncbi:ABC transporter substrate-binding protein [Chitinimonas naiadis]
MGGNLPRVVVIESYHAGYIWDAGYIAALQQGLAGKVNLDFFEMDTKRLPKEKHAEMADRAWTFIQEKQADAVILGDDAALKFLGPRLAGTATPVVYLGINGSPATYLTKPAPNITGVLERPSIRQTLQLAKQLQPGLKEVLVMLDNDLTGQQLLDYAFQAKRRQVVAGVQIEVALIDTLTQWQDKVRAFAGPDRALLLLGYFSIKQDGKPVDNIAVLRWTAEHADMPIYCNNDYAIGLGLALAGYINMARTQGAATAELLLKKLAHPQQAIPPAIPSTYHLLGSRSGLARFGMNPPVKLAEQIEWVD